MIVNIGKAHKRSTFLLFDKLMIARKKAPVEVAAKTQVFSPPPAGFLGPMGIFILKY